MTGTRTAPSAAGLLPAGFASPRDTVHPINVSSAPAVPSGAVGIGAQAVDSPGPCSRDLAAPCLMPAVRLAASVGTEFLVRPRVTRGCREWGEGGDCGGSAKEKHGPASLAQWIEHQLAD